YIQEEADEIRLTVKDNGRGLRQEDERPERSGSLGWRMIRSTVGKYAGTLEVDGSDGLSVAFRLPLADS
ncbi:MAG: histidine kinase, partial [Phaeobacter italicus]